MPVPTAVPPEGQLGDPGQGRLQSFDAELDRRGVATELLTQRDRRGVHQMGAPRLDDALEGPGLPAQRPRQVLEGRDEPVLDLGGGGQVHGRGEHVVGGLRGVDVVVGVHPVPRRSLARVARTSFMFMLVEVPEPVWKTSRGNSWSQWPAATS